MLQLHQLCKGFDHPVIDCMDLTIETGEFFVVVGPSGIGKTTLLRCVAGLEQPDAGSVFIDGQEMNGVPPYKRPVAMTFESYALYPHLTVFENIASPLRARKLDARSITEKVKAVAKLLRIDPLLDRRPGEISGGQKQRTALGRTLVAEPKVYLLDEPISHLDAKIRHELRQQFHTLEELRRTATLYVTHDYAEALSLGDRIGVMGDGGLVQIGTPHDVFERPESIFVARHLGQPSINEINGSLMAERDRLVVRVSGGAVTLPVADAHHGRLNRRENVHLGIRPQHIRILDGSEPLPDGHHEVAGTAEMFEALGATGVLLFDVGKDKLTCLTAIDRHFARISRFAWLLILSTFCTFAPRPAGASCTNGTR